MEKKKSKRECVNANMSKGQMKQSSYRRTLELTSDIQDEETLRAVITILRKKQLTVDRASRVLADAQSMLSKISVIKQI